MLKMLVILGSAVFLFACDNGPKPDIELTITGWGPSYGTMYDRLSINYSVKNNGPTDHPKYDSVWAITVPYYIELTNGQKLYRQAYNPHPVDLDLSPSCPKVGETYQTSEGVAVDYLVSPEYRGLNNFDYIKAIVPLEPEIEAVSTGWK